MSLAVTPRTHLLSPRQALPQSPCNHRLRQPGRLGKQVLLQHSGQQEFAVNGVSRTGHSACSCFPGLKTQTPPRVLRGPRLASDLAEPPGELHTNGMQPAPPEGLNYADPMNDLA